MQPVHGAVQAHAGDALGADLLQKFPNAAKHRLHNQLRILLGPVGAGIAGGIGAPNGANRLAPGVEYGALAAGGAGVTGEQQVLFHCHRRFLHHLCFLRFFTSSPVAAPIIDRRALIKKGAAESG